MSDELIPDEVSGAIADPVGPDSDDVPSIEQGDDEAAVAPNGNADED